MDLFPLFGRPDDRRRGTEALHVDDVDDAPPLGRLAGRLSAVAGGCELLEADMPAGGITRRLAMLGEGDGEAQDARRRRGIGFQLEA